jgi:Flp pilus assembly protein TadB
MTAVVVALLGAGVGVGGLIVVRAVRPRPVPLVDVAATLDRPGVAVNAPAITPDLTDTQRQLGARGVALMRLVGFGERDKLTEQLRVLEKPLERHGYEKMLAATAGFAIAAAVGLILRSAAVTVPAEPLGAAAVGLGIAGFFYPDLPLAEKVEERRRGFRYAFSAYLDLVTILLAGGAGIESALEGAAESGDGWGFAEIRRALRRARLTRQTPWDAFDQLGTELGVNELNELAASISLAGDHGARVKASLTAKADALRAAQAAELETTAEARTETMIVPVVVMILGLVLFIAFGAVDAITDGGSTNFAPTPSLPAAGGG